TRIPSDSTFTKKNNSGFSFDNFERSLPLASMKSTAAKAQNTENSQHTLCSSTKQLYALKKRILVPSWWIEGLLLSLGTREAWYHSFIASRSGKTTLSLPKISAKYVFPMIWVWNELLTKVLSHEEESGHTSFRVHLSKFLSGTSSEMKAILKEVEFLWTAPFSLSEVGDSKKNKSHLTLLKKGSINFIKHAFVESDVDGFWLTLEFSQKFTKIYNPINSFFKKKHPEFDEQTRPLFTSVNPTVFKSMGNKISLKKILNYLFFEYSKSNLSNLNNSWSSFPLQLNQMCSFHKENLNNAACYYDHGIFGWDIMAPPIKISEMKMKEQSSDAAGFGLKQNMSPQQSNSHHHSSSSSSILYCWQLSNQAKEAIALEHSLDQKFSTTGHELSSKVAFHQPRPQHSASPALFVEPPEDELKKIRNEKAHSTIKKESTTPRKQENKKNTPQQSAHAQITLFPDVEKPKPFSQFNTKHVDELTQNEFIVLVSEFYESLKPAQKKAFERERAGMNGDQFRSYMNSILQRRLNHHS
ncbi:MAG: hypothetical protein K2X39_00425, partial [Silvanigrellaceae bacterium]|nr:hypothetical protein [Silvanigrellaceae bacterium]